MNKTIAIIFLTGFFSASFLLSAQTSPKRGITAEEKRELEKKFAGLKTFYIDDDGTVVFYQENDNAASTSTSRNDKTTTETPPARVKVKVSVDEAGDYVVTSEESDYEYIESREIPTEADYIQPEKASGSKIVIETREEYTHTPVRVEKPINEEVIEESEIIFMDATTSEDSDNDEDPLKNTVKKEVFKKRVSSYKSLEEAALAVDELLEDLKKQQAEYNNRGRNSLSRKLSGGVDGSLRKTPYDFNDNQKNDQDVSSGIINDEETTDEPTYYINGIQSTKEEADKLKKSDILKKVIKRSRTNPNGEWWIETVKKVE